MKNSISSTEGSKKWQITLAKIFNWCFLIAMVLVLGCSIVFISGNDNLRHFNRLFIVLVISLAILFGIFLIYMTFVFFRNKSEIWNKKIQLINWIIIILLSIVITFTVQLNNQLFDGQYCINIAKQLAKTMDWHNLSYGNQFSGYYYALIRCYNMAPFIYFEAIIFKFCSQIHINLTFSEMIALGTYLNTIILLISMYLAFKLIKKHCKISTQTGFTFLLLINIPLYATVYNVYTDLPSLLAIMIILYTYDALISNNNKKNKIIFSIIIIITSIIGALLKFNVLIALIAIIIHYSLTHNLKKNIKFSLVIFVPIMLGINGAKQAITITSPIPETELGLPAINWINMSFSRDDINGGFNENYFKHTFKLKEKYNKKEVTKIETKEFIHGLFNNPIKYLYIMYQKIGSTYGIGNYDFHTAFRKKYLVYPNMEQSFFGKLLYGKYKKIFLYSTFILQLSMIFFMGFGLLQLIKNKQYITYATPWMIAFFGNALMLLFWEAHARYLLAFVGTIYMIACVGIEQVLDAHNQKKLKAKNK